MNRIHRPYRLAALASHPIQYQAPLFRALAARPEIDLEVFFCSRWGTEERRDPGFGVSFAWDLPLLEGYKYTFLLNLSPVASPAKFWGLINPGILRELITGKFDALWIHGWSLATNLIAWAGGACLGVPRLLRGEANGLKEPRGLKGIIKNLVLSRLFKQISGFLAIGTLNTKFYQSYRIPRERIFQVPYSVDNAYFRACAQKWAGKKGFLRKQKGLPCSLPIILFCGKFREVKRPLDLLQAFAMLGDPPPAALAFVGDGHLREEMERYVRERNISQVYFLGFRNQSELPEFYSLSDFLVLPSGFEPWGLVINEAMCFGLPIIASDQVGAAPDLVKDGVNGFVYQTGNVTALAASLRQIIQDEERRRNMGQESLKIINHWGVEEAAQGVVNCCLTLYN